ncbi:MAG TPA: hypothetical protein VJA21_02315 [Verrucomicrobiae bacterium]
MKTRPERNPTNPPGNQPEEIDLSLLEDSLRRTPWQRLLENDRALALVRMLETAQMPADGTPESDLPKEESSESKVRVFQILRA